MRKEWFVVLSVLFLFAMTTGCSDRSATVTHKETSVHIQQGSTAPAEQEKVKEILLGDTIITETMEVTINSVELTYDVLPDDTSGFYTHYEPDEGNVYISVDASVKNTAKKNLSCDEIGKIMADYNDGFTYNGSVVVKDSSTGFTYANISTVKPLETVGIKWLIQCPQEVEETENPLFLILKLSGENFKYTIR